MSLRDVYAEDARQTGVRRSPDAADQPGASFTSVVDPRVIIRADRGCCCTAKPSVVAIMPPTSGRQHQTDLLLCWHHYRVSRRTLAEAGAIVLADDGTTVADIDWPVASRA